MPTKPALTVERKYRSGSEERVAEQLTAAGIEHTYENIKVPYVVPQREAKYIPDFPIPGTNILIEVKGHFGGGGQFGGDITRKSAEARQKLIFLKEQHPEYDIRLVFDRAATKIYPKSPTTHGKWATDHGFLWADKNTIPQEWLDDIARQQKAARKRKRKKT